MKQFMKIVFASMLGTFVALFFLFFVGIATVAGIAATTATSDWDVDDSKIKDKSVLYFNLQGPIQDHVRKRDMFYSLFSDEPVPSSLFSMINVLEKAAQDKKIKGVLLHFDGLRGGMANIEALRRALLQFKESGKFIMAYAESYSEKDYMLASVADEVILYPKGFFEWDGVFSKMAYLQGTMKKLEIEPQIFRVGKYKSAIEPFINEKMSPESREQVRGLLRGTWQQLLTYAEEKTKLSKEELDLMADEMSVLYAKDALEKGFVNLLASQEEVDEKLKELTEVEEKPNYVAWRRYYKEIEQELVGNSDNKIALVFASGGISSDTADDEGISSKELTKMLHKIRRDEDVKAVVLRVNSPGGSALASDVIWTATQWLKDAKPVVTSFGNVAASGGYYMSAGTQYIFSEATTITGSIGVFGLTFATKKFWNDKIGMTFDSEKSHKFSDIQALVRRYNPEEKAIGQGMVDQIYEDFLNVVTTGRDSLKTRDETHALAQGRVWIGSKAQEIGLVDELGGVKAAIAKAAEIANVTDYDVLVYPRESSAFEEFMKQLGEISVGYMVQLIPQPLQNVLQMKKQKLEDQILMRLPFDIEIE